MSANYKTPGVYRREIFLQPEEPLQTGVPAFVGFADAVPSAAAVARLPVKLLRKEEFDAKFKTPAGGYLADAVKGFFDNGGASCYVAAADASAADRETALKDSIEALSTVADFDLLAVQIGRASCRERV